ncbi:MAG: precorrin-3B synthase [Rhizobiaceae bacterium]|nr:precorrin-3B synthase [Rhizobiaceae bacterium]
MRPSLARGACPSLSAPMATGDGLLARLNPRHGRLTAAQLAGVARAAGRHGNGLLEVTLRGSLQIRGLSERSAPFFAGDVAALEIAADEGPEIRVSALAGLAADDIADPRPLADTIRAHLNEGDLLSRLAPKTSILVDGGGRLGLADLNADVRLVAVRDGQGSAWLVHAGGVEAEASLLGAGDESGAASAALALLAELAARGRQARGRDFAGEALTRLSAGLRPAAPRPHVNSPLPVGRFELADESSAIGVSLPFGQVEASLLETLAGAVDTATSIHLTPGRGLLVAGLAPGAADRIEAFARQLGFVTDPADPRLRVVSCAGAPACRSSHLDTKAIARAIAADAGLRGSPALFHVSGCAKQCARPQGPSLSVVGRDDGFDIVLEGEPVADEVHGRLRDVAQRHTAKRSVPA